MIFPSLPSTSIFHWESTLPLTLLHVHNVGLASTRNPGQGAIDLGLSASTPEIKSNVSGNHHLEPENDANTEGGDS